MLMPYRRYAEFSGRSRRKEYWMFTLFLFLVGIVFNILMMTMGFSAANMMAMNRYGAGDPAAVFQGFGTGFWVLIAIYMVFVLATLIPSLAVSVRRLHDRDMSGWFLLLFVVLFMIPLVNFIAAIAYLVLMCLEGTKGPNKYGPDPLDSTGSEVFA
jgi:uncharacterized membrane protein YhaH (DUF805 family)